jgi:uncharacterized membrane protein
MVQALNNSIININILIKRHAAFMFLLILLAMVLFVVFNATFNNISVISWLSVLLVEETGVPGENHRPATSN